MRLPYLNSPSSDVIRFLVAGIWNTFFATLCFAFLLKVVFNNEHYLLALTLATILNVSQSFVCHRVFTFRSDTPMLAAYLKFYIVYSLQIVLTFALVPFCVELLKASPIVSQISVTCFTTVITYFGHKHFSFGQKIVFMKPRRQEDDCGNCRSAEISLSMVVCVSLIVAYIAFFVCPVFLNSATEMAFPHYLSSMKPIGVDLKIAYDFSRAWVTGAVAEYPALVYPPLERVLRIPLLLFSFRGAYVIQTVVTLLSFVAVMLWLPNRVSKSPDRSAIFLLLFAGLLSYGLQYELERGQSNVIAISFVAWSLMLFHYGKSVSLRLVAYLLFSCAIQLKLYPAVFVFGFARNARDWRSNLMRWSGLGLLNVAGLFALGWNNFCAFVSMVATNSAGNASFGNHSITSLAGIVQKLADGYTPQVYHPGEIKAVGSCLRSFIPSSWLHNFGSAVGGMCLVVLLCCFVLTLVLAGLRNDRASFKYLIIQCTLLGLLLPGISFDYKLAALSMAFTFFVAESESLVFKGWRNVCRSFLYFCVVSLFAAVLFPPDFRPLALRCSAPFLLSIAVANALLMVLERPNERKMPSGILGCPPNT